MPVSSSPVRPLVHVPVARAELHSTGTGSAVCVYCIIGPFWDTDLTFYLDDGRAGTFALAANTTRAYEYNTLVYSTASLRSQEHALTILSGTGGGNSTLILLDRIVYTYVLPPTCASVNRVRAGAWTLTALHYLYV